MCGNTFCAGCKPTQEIIDYASGKSHVKPTYGDSAQRYVTEEKRKLLFAQMRNRFDVAALEWPEIASYSINAHVQRLRQLGNVLLKSHEAPIQLRSAISETAVAIKHAKRPPRVTRGRMLRKAIDQAIIAWIRDNLAEAEMLTIGHLFFGVPKATTRPFNIKAYINGLMPPVAEELVAA